MSPAKKRTPRPVAVPRPPAYECCPRTFLGLEPEALGQAARVAVLPVPYEATVSYKSGTRDGPAALIEASCNVETYDAESGLDLIDLGIVTLPPMVTDARGPAGMVRRVERAVAQLLDDGLWPLLLGGEHTVTVGAVRACARRHPGVGVLQIDAHADMRDRYEGSPYSHACVMRRLADDGIPAVAVGIRSVCAEEMRALRERRLPVYWARDVAGATGWIDRVVEDLPDPVYVTVDLDGFDPSVVPGVGTPEPGGLGWYEALSLLRAVAARRRVVGADVVELRPLPGTVVSEVAAAKLAVKLIAYGPGGGGPRGKGRR